MAAKKDIDMQKIVAWCKENQSLVIAIVVSLVLCLGGVFYFLHGQSQNTAIDQELASAKSQLESLRNQVPYPNAKNIKFVEDEAVRVQGLLDSYTNHFAPIPIPVATFTASGFKYHLETMVADLNKKAKELSIQLPTNRVNFSYSFTSQRSNLQMDRNSLKIQAEQLAHVKFLCNELMDSGISEFIRIRRAAGATNDLNHVMQYLADYLPVRKIQTNKLTLVHPYEVMFVTSPGDLGKFISRLEQSPYGIIVKSLKVERANSEMEDELAGYSEVNNPIANRFMRGGMRGAAGMGMRVQQQAAAPEQKKTADEEELGKALPKRTTTVLKPSAVRATMYIDFVRLRTEEELAGGGGGEATGECYDLDGDGTMDIDADGNLLPTASMDINGNKVVNGKVVTE